MHTLLVVVAVVYFVAGLVVYASTDTGNFAHRIPFVSMVLSPSVVNQYLFLFVVALWPVWLAILALGKKDPP